jgi:hypothetical protein
MKYNVGDRVRIKNFDWFRDEGANIAVTFMMKYYGEVVTIKSVNKDFYRIKEDGGQYCWADEMIECKVVEEYKPELKFKVGDKVRIKSYDWYNINKDKDGFVHCGDSVFDNYMSVFCGSVVTIGEVGLYGYGIREDLHCRTWTDEMIKGLVEEETKPKFKVGDKITSGKATLTILKLLSEKYVVEDNFGECGILYFNSQNGWKIVEEETKPKYEDEVNGEYYSTPKYLVRPSGYQFKDENGNVINAQKIVLEKKTVEEKYSDVKIQIFGNVVILKGGINADNPTEYMNEVVDYVLKLLGKPKYNQFIEDYLDNPWVRILVFDFNSMEFNNSFDDIVTNFKKE